MSTGQSAATFCGWRVNADIIWLTSEWINACDASLTLTASYIKCYIQIYGVTYGIMAENITKKELKTTIIEDAVQILLSVKA